MTETDIITRAVRSIAFPMTRQRDAWLMLVFFSYLYVNLFADPRTPMLLGGDQLYFWMDAQRLLNGEQFPGLIS
jgi:hypothetical protein